MIFGFVLVIESLFEVMRKKILMGWTDIMTRWSLERLRCDTGFLSKGKEGTTGFGVEGCKLLRGSTELNVTDVSVNNVGGEIV